MFSRVKTYTLSSFILLAALFLMTQSGFAQPYACLPTCDIDGRFFVFAGAGSNSFIEARYVFGISSPGDRPTFEFGIFDGDDANSQGDFFSDWDQGGGAILRATLYVDPTGEGAQVLQVGQWSGDGSFGDNMGIPMPDNGWYDVTLQNTEAARTANGTFRYTLVVDAVNVENMAQNQYKIRTDGSMIILPKEEFAFMSIWISLEDSFVVWPNLTDEDFNNPACFDNVTFAFTCNMLDPDCCIGGGPYDGTWKFFIDVPPGEGVFNTWDGDFDFGSVSAMPGQPFNCFIDGIDVDTDDWNTPPGVPDFAQGTGAVPQSATIGLPPDNGCVLGFAFDPSINYDIITPSGTTYNNPNPSGTEEWELYNIGSVGNVDVQDSNIPGGIWTMMVRGTDFSNLNGLRFDHPVVAVNEMGDPVPFDPEQTATIPTLNEWGLITLSAFVLLISVYYLRRQRRLGIDIK